MEQVAIFSSSGAETLMKEVNIWLQKMEGQVEIVERLLTSSGPNAGFRETTIAIFYIPAKK